MKSAINIANYEEFFLLYVDGELSAAQKQAVEQFVQENPHLAEELDMLQQMKLPEEELLFADKDLLYRNGGAEINLTNYETHFLLYVDNELSVKEKAAVETFVLQHPSLQEQFMLLKKAKLEPEAIVFANKELLYRKEEKERRIIYMSWQRIAIAAVLIGLIVTVGIILPSKDAIDPAVTAQQQTVDPVAQPQAKTDPAGTNNSSQGIALVNTEKNVGEVRTNNNTSIQQPIVDNNIAQTTVVNGVSPTEQQKDVIVRNDPPQTIVTTRDDVENKNTNTSTLPSQLATGFTDTEKPIVKQDVVAAKNDQPENDRAVNAQPAVYKELDTDDTKKSLYVGSIEINKDKLRGFFRKATSIFRGKAKQQEEDKTESTPTSNTRSLR